MQLVHVLSGSKAAPNDHETFIIGIFFEPNGIENDFLLSFWEHLPCAATQMCYDPTTEVDLKLLVSNIAFSDFYSYEGSITTPPLSETATWLVVKKPLPCTEGQINHFLRNLGYNSNFRPPQPIYDRQIYQAEMMKGNAEGSDESNETPTPQLL